MPRSTRMSAFRRVTVLVALCLLSLIGAGEILRDLGAGTVGDAIQVVVTVPWVLFESAFGVEPIVMRVTGASVTAVMCGVVAAIREL